MAKTKLYTEKTKRKPAQKADRNGLASVPNYMKKVDKKAKKNSEILGFLDITWQKNTR